MKPAAHSLRRLLAVLFLAGAAHGQSLVLDINTEPDPAEPSSSPSPLGLIGGVPYLGAELEGLGRELMRTDGTAAGTVLVKDIFPGPGDGSPGRFSPLPSGEVVFSATTALGREVWKSDGTANGTVLVKDVFPGPTTSSPSLFTPFGGEVFFLADDGVHGSELWKTDGTPGGTVLVKDVVPGSTGLGGSNMLIAAGSLLYFTVKDVSGPTTHWELWKSDGTTGGTVFVADVTASSAVPDELTGLPNGTVVFAAIDPLLGKELWSSDGTAAGTAVVVDLAPGGSFSDPRDFKLYGNQVFFSAEVFGLGREPYVTDGTAAGTFLLRDIHPGQMDSNAFAMGEAGGLLLFAAATPGIAGELWRTDGTPAGTQLLKDLYPGGSAFQGTFIPAIEFGSSLVFAAIGAGVGRELWISDGTAAGSVLLADIYPGTLGSTPSFGLDVGGALLFSAFDGVHGRELWKTDGTTPGTSLVADLLTPGTTGSSLPSSLTPHLGRLYFEANDGVNGRELWSSDGTASGTRLLFDLNPGPASAGIHAVASFGDKLFFGSVDVLTSSLTAVNVTDGTLAGTVQLAEFDPPLFYTVESPTVFEDRLYFVMADQATGQELWVTDGTPAGTSLFFEFVPGPGHGLPRNLFVHEGELFFTAEHPTFGHELWKTDGTAGGTVLVKDVAFGAADGMNFSTKFLSFQGELYFTAKGELWKTDGTTNGTSVVAPGVTAFELHRVGDLMLFPGRAPGQFVYEPWRSDGTATGTVKIADFPGGIFFDTTAANDDAMFFWVDDGFTETNLWKTDGTLAGTQLVETIDPTGFFYQIPGQPLRPGSGDKLVFAVDDGVAGEEVWVTDGTAAGTMLLADAAPAGISSEPERFTRAGNLLFFTADDGDLGEELHVVPLSALPDYVAEPIGAGCAGTGGLVPVIGFTGTPTVGVPFDVTLADALPNAPAFLFFSFGEGSFDIGASCEFFPAEPFGSVPLATDALGEIAYPLLAVPAFVGLRFVFQYAVVDPGGAWFGLASASAGLEVVVGS